MNIPKIPLLRLAGADVLGDDRFDEREVIVSDGMIKDVAHGQNAPTLMLDGYYVMPGIIDLHGDAFEHHIAPRPSAPFPIEMGLMGTDRDAAVCGITTAWMAQSWSWEGGLRGPDFAEELMRGVQDMRAQLLTDLRIQIRCETHTVETQERLLTAVRSYGIDYVVFNNHLEEAVETARNRPEQFEHWAKRTNRTGAEFLKIVEEAKAQANRVPRYLCSLANVFDMSGIKYGSHDDVDGAAREYYAMIGAKICEFPTGLGAGLAAKSWGDPVIMGAPNVVRGGSQAGNVSAMTMIREGLCTALVSDYHYPTLAQSAFAIARDGALTLAEAWALISRNPAQIMELKDRGHVLPGKRADLVIINKETQQIEGTMAQGRWSYLAASLAHQLSANVSYHRVAAE
jgi:alpha-D-ribose 1-methylphosphonate 5-triphosphate diphosphatase